MTAPSFALFGTAIGYCGIAWGPLGIAGVQLPEADAARTRARLLRRFPGAREAPPTAEAAAAIGGMVALLSGEARDLSAVALDMRGIPEFERRVYVLARTIAPGATLSYGRLAERLGDAALARAVGRALGRNPFPLIVPCHRVLAANGKPGGFSAAGGLATKLRLLTIERARTSETPSLFEQHALGFSARPARSPPGLPRE